MSEGGTRTGARRLWPLAIGVVLLVAVGARLVRRHAGSWELVLGTSIGLVLCAVGAVWLVVRLRRSRARAAQVLDRARPGAPRWRCQPGPFFPVAMAHLGVRDQPSGRLVSELTLVEVPTGLEVWRDRPEPLLHLPWAHVASVDTEPVAGSQVRVLVIHLLGGHRVPLILMRERTGSQRAATAQTTEEYAAHLRRAHAAQR